MTLKKIAIKQCGKQGFKKLSPQLKKLIKDIDGLAMNKRPISRRLMEKALA